MHILPKWGLPVANTLLNIEIIYYDIIAEKMKGTNRQQDKECCFIKTEVVLQVL
jgi:hypothetical protein